MALARIASRAQAGLEAPPVTVEVHTSQGLPGTLIVGLPETVVRESKDRVRSALLNCGFSFPDGRITINLAPAELPKEGTRFDLPIAIGILVASGQLAAQRLEDCELYAELSLGGELKPFVGALAAALRARDAGREMILPGANAPEAALIEGAVLRPAGDLLEVTRHLRGDRPLPRRVGTAPPPSEPEYLDLADVRGQPAAKRALEVAAAGVHSLLLIGPPGSGKSMLAQRLGGLLPPLTDAEALETAVLRSLARQPVVPARWRERPFRSPHHSASAVALVGGGGVPRPGEISLAHNGVLFLDELPEFGRNVLEVLREPLEAGRILIARAARQQEFPARFQLVAAMNPCPCGHLGDPAGECRCTADQVQRYRGRLSGPLLDRIDLHVEVPRTDPEQLLGAASEESSVIVRTRIVAARVRQLERSGVLNSQLAGAALARSCRLADRERRMLELAAERLGLSARACHRTLKVARTIADLRGERDISHAALAEALAYRRLDRRIAGQGR